MVFNTPSYIQPPCDFIVFKWRGFPLSPLSTDRTCSRLLLLCLLSTLCRSAVCSFTSDLLPLLFTGSMLSSLRWYLLAPGSHCLSRYMISTVRKWGWNDKTVIVTLDNLLRKYQSLDCCHKKKSYCFHPVLKGHSPISHSPLNMLVTKTSAQSNETVMLLYMASLESLWLMDMDRLIKIKLMARKPSKPQN